MNRAAVEHYNEQYWFILIIQSMTIPCGQSHKLSLSHRDSTRRPEATTGLSDCLNTDTELLKVMATYFIKVTLVDAGHHSSLWLKDAEFDKLQKGYSQLLDTAGLANGLIID